MTKPEAGPIRLPKGKKLEKGAVKKQREALRAASKKQKIKQRQKVDTASKSLLPKGKEKTPGKFDILVEKVVLNEFGYKMLVLIPKGCDGTTDMYFPGGGSGISTPVNRDGLRAKWLDACKRGKRKALVIVEGRVKPTWHRYKYSYLRKSYALPSILGTVNSTAPGVNIAKVHLIGHSMGGQAINNLCSRSEVTGVTCLDSTYWSNKPIVDLALRGGTVNIVYKPGTKTAAVAKTIIRKLRRKIGLKKVAKGRWETSDGRVKIFATRMGHSALVKPFIGRFMGSKAVAVRTFSPFVDTYASTGYGDMSLERMRKAEKDNPAGALHKKYLERMKKIDTKTVANDVKTLQGSSIEDVRYNTRLLNKKTGLEKDKDQVANIKNETQRRIKAYTSGCDGGWYKLDYAKMGSDHKGRSHEDYVGIGDVFIDPSVNALLVDRGGEMILATRGVVKSGRHKGRVAFLDSAGKYVYTHTGDRARILSKTELADGQLLANYKTETAQRDKHEQIWRAEGDYSGGVSGGVSRAPVVPHSAERPSNAVAVDRALSKTILEEHGKLYKKGTHSVPGQCEGMAITVSGKVRSEITGDRFRWKSLRHRGLFEKATARFRGTLVNNLKEDDFAKPGESYNTGRIPIGAAMYGAMIPPKLAPYLKGDKRSRIAPVIKATQRHWWVYAGRDAKGRVIFVDNHKKNRGRKTLSDLKRSVGNRKIINIHDPYADLRGRMYVDASGNLKEKLITPKSPLIVSTGPASRYFPKTKRGEKLWKSIPEAGFVDDGTEINPREPFVSGKDSFGRTVILRRSAMRAFYKAREIAESGKYQTPPGPPVRLRVSSSYRSLASQRRLNPSGKGGKYVAAPGRSWHHSGGAIDVVAYVQNPRTGKWEGGWRHKNQIYLKKIMPRASLVNYSNEMWHWEHGTYRWKKKTGRRTKTYAKVMSVSRKRISKFDRLSGGPKSSLA